MLQTDTAPQGRIEILVSDQGIGMTQEEVANFWQPFYRSRDVTNIKGTGIGSTIAKTCIELHKGDVTVTSEKGKGTTIIVYLPV
ncbi:MAG: sensor histidine kinase [Bacteroidales bacterium]|nr:sensor histidine kinase [Bacteroidales bacterium]